MDKTRIRFQLFCNYLDELQDIKGLPPQNITKKSELFQEISADKNCLWIDVFEPSSANEVAGFLIVGTPPNCHPVANYYMEETYIKPASRRKKLMYSAASSFIKAHRGVYCLFIVNGNDVAMRFWNYVFEKIGYVPCWLDDVGASDEHCTQYGYRPGAIASF